jgi:adenylate cyclase
MTAKVLIVDDEADLELLVRQRFRQKTRDGTYEALFARNGREALDVLAAQPDVEVVFSDINMPGMDGLALLRKVKQQNPDLPVMMVTAYGDDERRRHAREYGAAEFITKPVDFNLLKEQLRQLPSVA